MPKLKLGNLDGGGLEAFRNSYNSSSRGNMKYTEGDEYKDGSGSRRQASTNRASMSKRNATIYIEDNDSYQDEEGDMMMYDPKFSKMKTEARPSPAHPHLSANSVMFGRSPQGLQSSLFGRNNISLCKRTMPINGDKAKIGGQSNQSIFNVRA